VTRHADDIPPRYEHKFLVPVRQADEIRHLIAPFCTLDPFSQSAPTHRYLVTSLYLDTPHLGFYRQSELAAPHRLKLRVRRYGDALGASPIFLEVKERFEDVTVKQRTLVTAKDWLARARGGGGLSAAERAFVVRRDRYRAQPILLIRYEREAWRGTLEAYARVTFDARVQYQRVDTLAEGGWSLVGDGGGWGACDDVETLDETEPCILVEIKFERAVPRWMVGVMRSLELVRRGYSKYGVGVRFAFDAGRRLDVMKRESQWTNPF
jgi:hypothetical protein